MQDVIVIHNRGIVYQNVDALVVADDLAHTVFVGAEIRHIEAEGPRAVRRTHFSNLRLDVDRIYDRAFANELPHDGRSDALRRSGDDRHAVFKFHSLG